MELVGVRNNRGTQRVRVVAVENLNIAVGGGRMAFRMGDVEHAIDTATVAAMHYAVQRSVESSGIRKIPGLRLVGLPRIRASALEAAVQHAVADAIAAAVTASVLSRYVGRRI